MTFETIRLCINGEELSCVFSNGNLSTKPLNYRLAKRLVFRKVRKALGLDRCTRCYTGAAPITKDTLEFFLSLDIPLFELYGMSESSGPHTISLPDAFRLTRYWHLDLFQLKGVIFSHLSFSIFLICIFFSAVERWFQAVRQRSSALMPMGMERFVSGVVMCSWDTWTCLIRQKRL